MADISFGYHSLSWGRNFVGFLDEVSSLGFRGVESVWDVATDYDGKEDALRKLLRDRNLTLVSLYGGGELADPKQRERDLDRNRRLVDFLARHGCQVFVFGPGSRGPKPPTRGDFERLIESAHLLGAYCRKRGIKACVHPHLGTIVETRDEIHRLMSESDPDLLFLCPDTAHIARSGADPAEVIRAYPERVAHVHFKDAVSGGPAEANGTPFVELGRGTVDFPSVLETLRAAGYRGWITVELDEPKKSAKESAAISKKYLKDVLHVKF